MKITMRPATKLPQIIIHRKVAAYCRVSTQQEIQHHSLEAQRYCAYAGRDSFTFLPFAKIMVRLGPALAGGAPPRRIVLFESPLTNSHTK